MGVNISSLKDTNKCVGFKEPTLYQFFYNHIDTLIPAFNLSEQRDLIFSLYEIITQESLNVLPENIPPKFSTINNDGIPFQFSVSLGKTHGGLRFLSEAGIPYTSMADRVNLSCQKIENILQILQLNSAYQSINTAFSILFPKNPSLLGSGGIWMAMGFFPEINPSFKIYVNAKWGAVEDNWYRFAYILTKLGRVNALKTFRCLLPILNEGTVPAGIAMDITDDGIGRIKIYLRSFNCESAYIERILIKTGMGKYVNELRCLNKNLLSEVDKFPPGSLVLSLEFLTEDKPDEVDFKVDACGHCLFSNDIQAKRSCIKEIKDLGFDSTDYETILAEISHDRLSQIKNEYHAFFGLGMSSSKDIRFDIYLKPSIRPATGLSSLKPKNPSRLLIKELDVALGKSIDYILSKQQENGKWTDFELPVGKSNAWITGYVAYNLTNIGTSFDTHKIETSLSLAAKWCIENMNHDGGWGYNERCDTDADSTAYIILFLSSIDQATKKKSYEKLLSFQNEDGGFSTYRIENSTDSWGISHTDVTPVALMALLTKFSRDNKRILLGERYILSQINKKGYWNSFWWNSPIYSSYVNLSFLEKIGSLRDRNKILRYLMHEFKFKNAFECALLAGCIMSIRTKAEEPKLTELVKWMLTNQQENGCWIDEPILRLTYSNSTNPWSTNNSGKLFADKNKLFVTATVMRCISIYRDVLMRPST